MTAEVDRATLAFEFGKAFRRDHPSVAAVIVGEEMVGEPDVTWLVVTAATVLGERRTTCMKMIRLPDGSLRTPQNKEFANVDSNELDCHLASEVLKGILFQGEPV
jgi:hypothetical protein